MDKYIIREVAPDCVDVSIIFDDDGIKAVSGFEYQLFIIADSRRGIYGFNADNYKDIVDRIDNFLSDFTDRQPDETRKDVMQYYDLKYSPALCHKLSEYAARVPYVSRPDNVADFLTLTTGHKWNTYGVSGYCQGDFVTVMYCADIYDEKTAQLYGEYYLGCCKEFSVTTLDENGAEIDTCYGFFVADCEIENWRDTDNEYKRIICKYAEIDEKAATLELFDGYNQIAKYHAI